MEKASPKNRTKPKRFQQKTVSIGNTKQPKLLSPSAKLRSPHLLHQEKVLIIQYKT